MKRKLAWVCLLVSPLVIGGAALWFLGQDSITEENCAKIKKGMTEKEVAAILGREKDDKFSYAKFGREYPTLLWIGARGKIAVEMQWWDDAFVNGAYFLPSPPQTFIEKIKRRLGR
jgi:hypothetical protein